MVTIFHLMLAILLLMFSLGFLCVVLYSFDSRHKESEEVPQKEQIVIRKCRGSCKVIVHVRDHSTK